MIARRPKKKPYVSSIPKGNHKVRMALKKAAYNRMQQEYLRQYNEWKKHYDPDEGQGHSLLGTSLGNDQQAG